MLRLNATKENIHIFIIRCDIYLVSTRNRLSAAYREVVTQLCVVVFFVVVFFCCCFFIQFTRGYPEVRGQM